MKTRKQRLVFDEIGVWSELKLEIVKKYGSAYTNALKNQKFSLYYIDGFSGPGYHVSKETLAPVEGSPANALLVRPPFDRYVFIDLDSNKTSYLKTLCEGRKDVAIHTGDCNDFLLKDVFPKIKYAERKRGLCLLDPYGLDLNWNVIKFAGNSKTIDLLINFPIMDINRNVLRRYISKVSQKSVERMNRFWGDQSWRKLAYFEQNNLFGEIETLPYPKKEIVEAFRDRLKTEGGFKFVPAPLPMKNHNNAIVYFLFFGTQVQLGEKIITNIFDSYRKKYGLFFN